MNQNNGSKKNTIITRYPNLEVVFFAAILKFYLRVRRTLGITEGKLEWKFLPSGAKVTPKSNEVCFDNGGNGFDHHGQGGDYCSLDIVAADANFVEWRKYLYGIFDAICNNDLSGERLSRGKYSLRELIGGLTSVYPENPQLVLDWGALAMIGVIRAVKKNPSLKPADAFVITNFLPQVEAYLEATSGDKAKDDFFAFTKELGKAKRAIDFEWLLAEGTVKAAISNGSTREINILGIDRTVKVIQVFGNSMKIGPFTRQAGYDICIQVNLDGQIQEGQPQGGHVQIFTRNIYDGVRENGQKIVKRINLAYLVGQLRKIEAGLLGMRRQDLAKTPLRAFGLVLGWCFHDFLVMVSNGTLSNKEIPPTKIKHQDLLDLVSAGLTGCLVFEKDPPEVSPSQNQSAPQAVPHVAPAIREAKKEEVA